MPGGHFKVVDFKWLGRWLGFQFMHPNSKTTKTKLFNVYCSYHSKYIVSLPSGGFALQDPGLQ